MTPEPIVVSYSEIDTYRQCPLKWWLTYHERWQGVVSTSGPRARGTFWHKVLEAHYKSLQKLGKIKAARIAAQAVIDAHWQMVERNNDTDLAALCELIEWMYQGYMEYFGADDRYRILAVEHTMVVPLRKPDGSATRFSIKAKIDVLFEDRRTQLRWLVDNKSHDNLPKDQEFDLDDQFPLYEIGLEAVGHPVAGSIYNAARSFRLKTKIQPLEERFERWEFTRTRDELANVQADVLATIRKMYSKNTTHERYPNPRTCSWRCDFTEPCITGRKYGEPRMIQHLRDLGLQQDFQRH